jgi:hypothetical protein
LVERELRSGVLQVLDNETFATNNNYFLVTPAKQSNQLATEFCAWVIAQIGLTPI